MKRWVGAVILACALVAVWQLPPDSYTERGPRGAPPSQEQARLSALADDVRRSRSLLRTLQWSDSLSAHLVERAHEGWAVGIQGADTLRPEAVQRFRDEFRREVEAIPNRRDDVVLGAFVQSAHVGDHPADWDAVLPGAMTQHLFFGRRNGATYCFVVEPTQRAPDSRAVSRAFSLWSSDEQRRYDMLGACRWVAELGLPGPLVTRWLQDGGYLLANGARDDDPAARSLDARATYLGMPWRRGPFGVGWQVSDFGACRAGLDDACARFFSDPRGGNIPFSIIPRSWSTERAQGALGSSPENAWFAWRNTYGWSRDAWQLLFVELYRDFGHERMAAFWASDAEPLAAFRAAFGIEAGAWVAEWARRDAGYVPPGPLPRRRAVTWTLAVLLAGAGLASVAGMRRTVM